MNLIFEFYSVSIVSMDQIFSKHKRQRTQRSHFETPFSLKPKQKTNLCNLSIDTYLSIFLLFETYCNSMPSLKQLPSVNLKGMSFGPRCRWEHDDIVFTLHEKPYFLYPDVLKRWFFQKKLQWNMIFLVSSGKIIFLFPENIILHVGRKMKDDLS